MKPQPLTSTLHSIYRISCSGNGSYYIGRSNDMEKRWKQHLVDLRGDRHCNAHLQSVFNKYGEESFSIERVCWVPETRVVEMEQRFLDKHFGKENCMNLTPSSEGMTHTPESKRKLSEALTGKPKSEEHRRNMSKAVTGEKHPNFGKNLSEKTRRRISEAHQNRSEETRRRMSEAQKGREFSEEHKRNLSEAKKGKPALNRKLTMDQANEIRKLHATGDYTQTKLAKMFGTNLNTINRIIHNKAYKND